jgi:hypothetical protein
VFRASKTAALTVVRTGALTVARRTGVPIEARILEQMWALDRVRTSVRTSGRDQALTLERMPEPVPGNPAQDLVPAARPHRMRARQPVRALVRLGHLLAPQAFRELSTPEQTAAPMVGPAETAERTVAHSGTAEPTEVPIAGPTAVPAETAERTAAHSGTAEPTEVPIAEQMEAPTAEQTAAPGTMRSALTGVLGMTATWPAPEELLDRKVDPTARRLRPEPVEPPEWRTAAPMVALTEELMAAPKRATGLTARPQIQTSIATIFNGGLIPIDSTS